MKVLSFTFQQWRRLFAFGKFFVLSEVSRGRRLSDASGGNVTEVWMVTNCSSPIKIQT